MKSAPGFRVIMISLAAVGSAAAASVTSKNREPVILFTASMQAANPDAVWKKCRRDSRFFAAYTSANSRIRSPMLPARKSDVPCSSGVIGPLVVRL